VSQNKRLIARDKELHARENLVALGRTLRGTYSLDEPLPPLWAEILSRLNEKEFVPPSAEQAKLD